VLPHFRQNKAGVIVNISSRAGLVGLPMVSLYCAAKHALEGFSEALAFELASQNIKVKIVEPSGGVTGTTFSRRMGEEHGQVSAPADYDQFVARMNAVFASNTATRVTTADEVAGVIFGAATDGTDRLRYFVGEDTGGPRGGEAGDGGPGLCGLRPRPVQGSPSRQRVTPGTWMPKRSRARPTVWSTISSMLRGLA
jgi:NAD(P)-dependent dehydrogenase (short-subunit alcohol dehydrogenase family)